MNTLRICTAFFLTAFIMTNTGCSADSQSNAWQALAKLRDKDYFCDPLQLKLAAAIEHGDLQQMEEIIKQGADVNAVGRDEMRPLFWAMARKSLKGFEVLLQNGADSNVTAKSLVEGRRPLSVMELAAIAETSEYLRLALKHKGNPNFPLGYGGRTIIHEAIINERIDNVRTLMEFGVDLSQQDEAGQTAMLTAASIKKYDVVFLMLEKGADPALKDRWGYDLESTLKQYGTRGIAPESEQYQWYLKVVAELKRRKN